MKKNGYLRKFIAMFLVFVMLMADSSMTTFASSFTFGRVKQQNADEGVAVQSSNDVNVTVNAPDGTYYLAIMKDNDIKSKVAQVNVSGGNATATIQPKQSDWNISNGQVVLLKLKQGSYNENYDQNNYIIQKNGEILRTDDGKVLEITATANSITLTQQTINAGTTRSFKDILGSSTNFGIVANEATFRGHLESNFAIGKLYYRGSNVQMSRNVNGGAGYNYIGEFVGDQTHQTLQIGLNGNAGGSVVYAGKGVKDKLTSAQGESDLLVFDYDTYSESQIKQMVRDMVGEIAKTSTTLYKEQNTVDYDLVTDISKDGNQYTDINIAKYGSSAGTYYISFKPGEFKTFMNSTNNTITIRDDQNIVLNIPDTDVKFSQFRFKIVDSNGNIKYSATTNADATEDLIAENVIFNCPNATNAVANLCTGIFLVPNASFSNVSDDLGGVSAGWVIANVIRGIGGQEWHNIYKGMPVVDTTFQIKATKNVDNNPATDEKYSGKFSFDLQQKDGENWKTIDSVTNVNSSIVFNNLGKFKTVGTHFYRIVETASALPDVSIDNNPVYVKAVINKNGNKLVATVTYYSDENYSTAVSNPSFNNTTVQQKGNLKIVKAAGAGTNLSGKTFYFKVTDSNKNVVKNNESNVWPIEYNNGAEITITDLTPGVYTVVETDEKGNAVTTGTSFPYTVSGDENVIVENGNTATITVTNTAVSGTKITLTGTKELKNRKLADKEFEFEVKEGDTVVATGTNDADGKITFSEISYGPEAVGDHTYKISEKTGTDENIEYSTEVKTVVVNVSLDQKTGKMEAKIVSGKSENVKFTNTYKTISISGTKHWDDNNNQDGKRPESITVNLLADGNVYASQTVTAASNWTYNFTDLPKYKAGKEIKYKVEEVAVTDYTTEVDGYDIYNTHTPETTSISGTKTWDDADDQDGKRPDSIKVNLLANGEVVQTKTVTEKDNWSYTFDNLPVYEEGKVGQKLTYTISEESVKAYTTVVKDNNIINSYTPGKVGVSVTKIWDDAGNQDGIRPEKITVNLLADGQDTGKTATLSADNNWTQSITGLDEKKDGKAIEYTWAEENVPKGYELTGNTTSGTVTTLTNKHVPEVTAITGTKTWNDNDDQDGKRPTSITVNLLADGNVYATKTVTATTNWTYTFDNLPVYANGQKVTYTVSEDEVAGYETAIDGFNITNSYTPETISVSGQKVWDDANNQDGKRPNSIKVRLLANGTEVATKDVTAADNWAYNFTDLPKYANGEEIVYTVTEDTVADYTTAINGTTITNSYTPGKTSITVTKAWVDNDNQDGIRPENIKVQLYAGEDAQGEEVTLGETNNWTYTWTGLDAKKDGQDIVYTVKEVGEVTGYTSQISGDAQTGYVITNTHTTETTSVEGKKVWDDANNQDGKRPDSIKVRLLANGTEVATKDVTAADNWTYSFTDLPKFANGEKIVYTVTEDKVADYTTVIDGTTITNSYKPGKTSITVTKAWADNDNQDGIRPESVKVQLYAGETAQGEEVTLSADNNWTYTWSELDAKKDGQDIVYTVRETEVPAGYEATVTGTAAEGFILTNTHETEIISVEGTKTWNDNNQTAKRPESITVRLLADGKEAGSQKVTADSNWTYKFTELPKYAAGKEIVYTVSEDAVPGYITSVNGNNLINTITSVKVSKVDITDHKELAGAHIQIFDKDGNIIDEWDSTWEAHEVTGLKTNEQYTLRETVAPDGYTVTSDTTFTLKEDGTVDKDNTQTTVSDDGTLLVEDSKTSVKVSKVDIADGKELEGAHIQVIDEDENIVAEWDSTKEPHVIEGLKTDKKYILRETVAPTGYELTNDTTFVLKADGTVDTEKTTTVSKDGVLLVQDKLATGQSIAVTKKLTTITGDLRAMDQTFYVALYSDEACTQRVSDVKAIEFKNASSSTVVFNENIEVNKDYYIAECSQDGTAQSMGALADGTMYEAKFNNGNKATVKEANGTTTVYFDNVFSSIPDGYYKQGKLTITKKLLGADGNAKKSDNVFYAGIFDDADYTQLSTQVSQNIVKLDLAGGSEVSQVIKIGLDVNKTVTLYVTETDSNGKPVAGTSGFAYKVSVDGSTVTIDEANENASVTITNTENPTTTTTTTEEKEESNGGSSASSHSMSSSTKAPKTGDDTPIAMYVIILIAAAALIVFGFEKRRRSNRK